MPIDSTTTAADLFLCLRPTSGTAAQQWRELFGQVADQLRRRGARILHERLFATDQALAIADGIRADCYGDLDDGCPPSAIVVPAEDAGPVAGLQIHAVTGGHPTVVTTPAGIHGRRVALPHGGSWLSISQSARSVSGTPARQTTAAFAALWSILQQEGAGPHDVVRTWCWLTDILRWYDDFNQARTASFREVGLLRDGGSIALPASTGVGLTQRSAGHAGLEAIALVNGGPVDRIMRAGQQDSAFAYGSAFARAASCTGPGGPILFVSGTAAIDATGATTHPDRPLAQIEDTLTNLAATLADAGCSLRDIVSSTVYCRDPAIAVAWRQHPASGQWPQVVVRSDICRGDLHVEIEATARVPLQDD